VLCSTVQPPLYAVTPTDDHRSYHVSSEKIKKELGWSPKRTVEDAITDLCAAVRAGKIPNSLSDTTYINVKTVQAAGLV